eukprot:m.117733 g.117733  ORF g.117733 m.117733 type:complete len:562 (+) comp14258_c0_seq2:426-2111(+)
MAVSEEDRRAVMDVFVLQYLSECGYFRALAGFSADAGLQDGASLECLPKQILQGLVRDELVEKYTSVAGAVARTPTPTTPDRSSNGSQASGSTPHRMEVTGAMLGYLSQDYNLDEHLRKQIEAKYKGSFEGKHGPGRRKVSLRPLRDAPAPPVPIRPERPSSLTKSPNKADDDTQSADDAFCVMGKRLKIWLKRHRLHKYLGLFAPHSYSELIGFKEDDLEKLGIKAQGARNKMMKSISDLIELNKQRESDLEKIAKDLHANQYSAAIGRLNQMFKAAPTQGSSSSIDGPMREGLDFNTAVMSIIHDAVVWIKRDSKTDASNRDIHALLQVMDVVLRNECFSVEERTQLFSWKADCERSAYGESKAAWNVRGAGGLNKDRSDSGRHRRKPDSKQRPNSGFPPRMNESWTNSMLEPRSPPEAAKSNTIRVGRPFSTGSMYSDQSISPMKLGESRPVTNSLFGSGDLFDPIWSQSNNAGGYESRRQSFGSIEPPPRPPPPSAAPTHPSPPVDNSRPPSGSTSHWMENSSTINPDIWASHEDAAQQQVEALTISMTEETLSEKG